MNKPTYILLGIGTIVLLGILGVLAFQGGELGERSGKPKVAATIYPLYDIAQNVAGDAADVRVILPPGASPHFFEFTPRQLQELQGTQAVFAIGYGLDDWVHRVEEAIPGAQVYIVEKGIDLRETGEEEEEEHEDKGEHEHGHVDPHYWLHFGNARQIAQNVADVLSELDAEHAETYQENARNYQEQLSRKEQELKAKLEQLQNRNVVTLHDAWFYFAENFDLTIVGTFEPAAGEEPSPQFLARLRQSIAANEVHVVFTEPQHSASFDNFAKDNNLTLAVLDPGERFEIPYLELMEQNVEELLQK